MSHFGVLIFCLILDFGTKDSVAGKVHNVLEQKMEAGQLVAQQQSCSSTVAFRLAVWTNLVG